MNYFLPEAKITRDNEVVAEAVEAASSDTASAMIGLALDEEIPVTAANVFEAAASNRFSAGQQEILRREAAHVIGILLPDMPVKEREGVAAEMVEAVRSGTRPMIFRMVMSIKWTVIPLCAAILPLIYAHSAISAIGFVVSSLYYAALFSHIYLSKASKWDKTTTLREAALMAILAFMQVTNAPQILYYAATALLAGHFAAMLVYISHRIFARYIFGAYYTPREYVQAHRPIRYYLFRWFNYPEWWDNAYLSPFIGPIYFRYAAAHEFVHYLEGHGYIKKSIPTASAVSIIGFIESEEVAKIPKRSMFEFKNGYSVMKKRDPARYNSLISDPWNKLVKAEKKGVRKEIWSSYALGWRLAGIGKALSEETDNPLDMRNFVRLISTGMSPMEAEEAILKKTGKPSLAAAAAQLASVKGEATSRALPVAEIRKANLIRRVSLLLILIIMPVLTIYFGDAYVSIVKDSSQFNFGLIDDLAQQITALKKEGRTVLIISSGAIALGNSFLEWKKGKDIIMSQCAAAVGQTILMHHYSKCFQKNLFHNFAVMNLSHTTGLPVDRVPAGY